MFCDHIRVSIEIIMALKTANVKAMLCLLNSKVSFMVAYPATTIKHQQTGETPY